jgi:hypothetical protein
MTWIKTQSFLLPIHLHLRQVMKVMKFPREEDGALSKLMEQVKYLSAQLEGLKYEDNVQRIFQSLRQMF